MFKLPDDVELTHDEILAIVKSERATAATNFGKIQRDRARALDYINADPAEGHLARDLPPIKGQSQAVSTDTLDAIETVLPDIVEIFTAGDDVVEFSPRDEDDEAQARQETEYLNYVFYQQNDGFNLLYTNFRDGLEQKTGAWKYWWDTETDYEYRVFENKPEVEMTIVEDVMEREEFDYDTHDGERPKPYTDENGDDFYTFRVRKKVERGRARIEAVPPEDFFIDLNAKSVHDAVWAAHRTRVTIADLIDQGIDRDQAISLFDNRKNADDFADVRQRRAQTGMVAPNASHKHKLIQRVEVIEYHIWLDADGDDVLECWRVLTGNQDSELLHMERIDRIQFAINCPYPRTHEVYGKSLADLLVETQKIKTALTRTMLNDYFFSVNPRPHIDMSRADKTTITDLMDNRPGVPIREGAGGAVSYPRQATLGDRMLPVLEYMSTEAEKRTGVVRNAQGLNPDTLHDTARGAAEFAAMAQKRVRMIARVFAETGVKDLFLGLHDLIVKRATQREKIRLSGTFVEVDPNAWDRRKDITCDVGLGTNTAAGELAFWDATLEVQVQALQFGLTDASKVYNAIARRMKAGGVRNPELFFTDPANAPEGQQQQPQQAPDPQMVKVQGELQLQAEEQKAEIERKREEMYLEHERDMLQLQIEAQLAQGTAIAEAELAREAQDAQRRVEEFRAQNEAGREAFKAKAKADVDLKNVRMGGKIG